MKPRRLRKDKRKKKPEKLQNENLKEEKIVRRKKIFKNATKLPELPPIPSRPIEQPRRSRLITYRKEYPLKFYSDIIDEKWYWRGVQYENRKLEDKKKFQRLENSDKGKHAEKKFRKERSSNKGTFEDDEKLQFLLDKKNQIGFDQLSFQMGNLTIRVEIYPGRVNKRTSG